jgi:hypothetical protein
MRKSTVALTRAIGIAGFFLLASAILASVARAQDGKEVDPAAALQAMLTAACRQDETVFRNYLTKANGAAFAQLTATQRLAIVKRFALLDKPGRPLLSSGAGKIKVLACEGPGATVEFRMGAARVEENTAYISVEVSGQSTQFGMVREGGGWRLLSLGLLLFDVPQLVGQWAQQDLEAREDAAAKTLAALAEAIGTYQRSFGQLPESLAQLGPATEGASPDAANLIAGDLAAGSRNGYQYRYQILPVAEDGAPHFELMATPEEYGKTGRQSFLVDGKGQVHAADKNGKVATVADPLLAVTGTAE